MPHDDRVRRRSRPDCSHTARPPHRQHVRHARTVHCHTTRPDLSVWRPWAGSLLEAPPTLNTHTHTRTHPFNGPLSRTSRVSRYQKGKTNLDFTEARDSEWQWHQLGHIHYTSLHLAPGRKPRQHPTTQFFTGRMPFLPPNQQRHSTEGSSTLSQML